MRTSPETETVEAAQIARAGNGAALRAERERDRAIGDVALIAGVPVSSVQFDLGERTIRTTAAPLTGLGIAGYRYLERCADAAVADWHVVLSPPNDVGLPDVTIKSGVIDDQALGEAGWVSARLARTLNVLGGKLRQRMAIAQGIGERGGRTDPGRAGGRLRLIWSIDAEQPTPVSGERRPQPRGGPLELGEIVGIVDCFHHALFMASSPASDRPAHHRQVCMHR